MAVAQRAVALNQDLKAITPYDGVDSSFLAYWIRAHEAPLLTEWRKEGTTVESLETELIKNTWVSVPPLDEQEIIAGFLDLETRRLGDLIAKKERLIELLEEKRTALITQAVTKGLDPDVPMKDSGVEWIGKIPEHWETPRLGMITKVRCDGPFGSKITSGHYRSEGARVVRLQNIGWAEFKGGSSPKMLLR